jgi:hypothetical protein
MVDKLESGYSQRKATVAYLAVRGSGEPMRINNFNQATARGLAFLLIGIPCGVAFFMSIYDIAVNGLNLDERGWKWLAIPLFAGLSSFIFGALSQFTEASVLGGITCD